MQGLDIRPLAFSEREGASFMYDDINEEDYSVGYEEVVRINLYQNNIIGIVYKDKSETLVLGAKGKFIM